MAWVEILFPLIEVDDPATWAFFVDGGSNQAYPNLPTGGTLAPGALPHQIGTDNIYGPPEPTPGGTTFDECGCTTDHGCGDV